MFALSQRMYLFEANLDFLTDTLTPNIEQHQLGQNLTTNCLCCRSTGLTERKILTQYYITMGMYTPTSMDSQVCNYCSYRQNNMSEVLSEDVRSRIYTLFLLENTFKKNFYGPFFMYGVQLPQGQSHFQEAVYFLPLSFQTFLVLILPTSKDKRLS